MPLFSCVSSQFTVENVATDARVARCTSTEVDFHVVADFRLFFQYLIFPRTTNIEFVPKCFAPRAAISMSKTV